MSNLIDDIRRAREVLKKREADASEAGYVLKMCRAEHQKARMALDELLDELLTGQSRYPMFERIERSNGNHDEHQRGPTSFPDMQQREAAADAEPQRSRRKKKAGQGDASIAP